MLLEGLNSSVTQFLKVGPTSRAHGVARLRPLAHAPIPLVTERHVTWMVRLHAMAAIAGPAHG